MMWTPNIHTLFYGFPSPLHLVSVQESEVLLTLMLLKRSEWSWTLPWITVIKYLSKKLLSSSSLHLVHCSLKTTSCYPFIDISAGGSHLPCITYRRILTPRCRLFSPPLHLQFRHSTSWIWGVNHHVHLSQFIFRTIKQLRLLLNIFLSPM